MRRREGCRSSIFAAWSKPYRVQGHPGGEDGTKKKGGGGGRRFLPPEAVLAGNHRKEHVSEHGITYRAHLPTRGD